MFSPTQISGVTKGVVTDNFTGQSIPAGVGRRKLKMFIALIGRVVCKIKKFVFECCIRQYSGVPRKSVLQQAFSVVLVFWSVHNL